MHQRFDQRLGVALTNRLNDIGIGGGKSDADSWLREIHHCEANEERSCGYDLEIDQRFGAHASHFSQRAGTGDPDDDGRKYERRDDGFN